MKCSKCGSENVNIQIVTENKLVRQHHSCLYWIVFGWWFELIMWLILTLPRLIILVFFPKRKKLISKNTKQAVCQNCGNTWSIK